jgi:vancomycin resistance protein VanW
MFQESKRSLRAGYKYAKNLLRGYPFAYARQQIGQSPQSKGYLWYEVTTPIPDRGTPEIRHNRIANLELAASRIHQLQLDPGKIFSFCDRVGAPTLRNGFKAGPVFVRGQVQTGVGGGLCLIATNLFDLFLYAGCQILERHSHSIDAYGANRFYELGEDAAVAYGYKDLMIRNQSCIPLRLNLQIRPDIGQVISSLWGQSPCPWEVKVNSAIVEEIPATFGNGLSGWVVTTERHIRDRQPKFDADPWQLNYHTTSVYNPCVDSSPPLVTSQAL